MRRVPTKYRERIAQCYRLIIIESTISSKENTKWPLSIECYSMRFKFNVAIVSYHSCKTKNVSLSKHLKFDILVVAKRNA